MHKRTLAIAASAVGLTLAAGITSALAASGSGETLHDWMQNQREEIESALAADDYETWSALSLERNARIKSEADSKITEENFEIFQEANELLDSDPEAARELLRESGLGHESKRGEPRKFGYKGHNGHRGTPSAAVHEALENEDFEAWSAAITEQIGDEEKAAAIATQERYEQMLEMHSLMESGDRDGAGELGRQWPESHRP